MQEGAVGENFGFVAVHKTLVQRGITQLGRFKLQGAAPGSILSRIVEVWRIHHLQQHDCASPLKLEPGHWYWIVGGVAAPEFSWIVEPHLLIRLIRLPLHLRLRLHLSHNHYAGKEMLLPIVWDVNKGGLNNMLEEEMWFIEAGVLGS